MRYWQRGQEERDALIRKRKIIFGKDYVGQAFPFDQHPALGGRSRKENTYRSLQAILGQTKRVSGLERL